MNQRLHSLGPRRHRREARRRRTADRSTTACGCSSAPDLLAVGWLANREREKRHGGRTYYNFNIRLEATNVCVASCLFCSFARLRPGDAGLVHDVARAGVGQAARARPPAADRDPRRQRPASRICRSTTTWRCCAASSASGPSIHLKCFTAVEIAFFADLYRMTDEQVLRELQDGRPRLAARRRRRDFCRARAPEDLPRQVRRGSIPRRFTGSRTGSACART